MTSKGYRDLIVWQEAIELVEIVYVAVKDFRKARNLRTDKPDAALRCLNPF